MDRITPEDRVYGVSPAQDAMSDIELLELTKNPIIDEALSSARPIVDWNAEKPRVREGLPPIRWRKLKAATGLTEGPWRHTTTHRLGES